MSFTADVPAGGNSSSSNFFFKSQLTNFFAHTAAAAAAHQGEVNSSAPSVLTSLTKNNNNNCDYDHVYGGTLGATTAEGTSFVAGNRAPDSKSTVVRSSEQIILADLRNSSESSSDSLNLAGPRNEILTQTTDYDENRSITPDNQSLLVRFVNVFSSFQIDSPPPTLFFHHRQRRRRIRRSRSRRRYPCFFACCCWEAADDGSSIDVIDRRAPPSYSALMAREREINNNLLNNNNANGHVPVLMGNDNETSFVAYTPPPSYAQAQGISVPYSIERLISVSESAGVMISARSTTAICPRCATLVLTVVEVQRDTATHVTAVALFLMGCWPCCMLPYCIDSCKKSHHYCPYCHTYIGTYTP